MNERVTVVILSHSHPEWLSRSVESVIKQTYQDIETIVISSVITNENPANSLKGHNITYLKAEHADFIQMISRAVSTATGNLVAFLNEGDIFSPKKIEVQVNALNSNPDVGLIFTAYQTFNEAGELQNTIYMPEFRHHNVASVLLNGHILSCSTAMVRKERCSCIDNLMTEIDLWTHIAKHCKIGVINMPLVRQMTPSGKNVQDFVIRALDSITITKEFFPDISLQPESLSQSFMHVIKGSILMRYKLHKSAMDNFAQAQQLCPDNPLHLVWMGMLLLQVGDYNTAMDYLVKVPKEDKLYLDAQWMVTLASQAQGASDEVQDRINVEVSKQYSRLLNKTFDIADGINPDTETLDITEEVSLYLNWDISQTFKALFLGGAMLADEWNQNPPQTSEKITDFYKQTGNYIFDLAGWHRDPARKRLTETVISICKQNNVQKVLDFGCGIGQDGILFSEAGFDVTLSDLPGRTFDFTQWRVKRKGLNINIVNSNELSERYDAILCFDVLEHVWEPKNTVEYLYKHLSDNGFLLLTTSFEQRDTHPMHLERNSRYLGDEFIRMMGQVGFQLEQKYRTPLVFRKK